MPCGLTDAVSRLEPEPSLRRDIPMNVPFTFCNKQPKHHRNPHCDSPHPPHPHALRYGCSGQTPVYLASRTYGLCLTIRTGPREARSQRLHVAERSATEFIEILYTSTTPMHTSHCSKFSTPHSYSPTGRGRTCMTSVSEITVTHLLLS